MTTSEISSLVDKTTHRKENEKSEISKIAQITGDYRRKIKSSFEKHKPNVLISTKQEKLTFQMTKLI